MSKLEGEQRLVRFQRLLDAGNVLFPAHALQGLSRQPCDRVGGGGPDLREDEGEGLNLPCAAVDDNHHIV